MSHKREGLAKKKMRESEEFLSPIWAASFLEPRKTTKALYLYIRIFKCMIANFGYPCT